MKYLKKISLVSTLFALLLAFSITSAQAQDSTQVPQKEAFMVKGKVIDAETMDVVADAKITIEGQDISAATDGEGKFKLENLPAGNHTLKVELDGYQTWEKQLALESDTDLEIKLKPNPMQ